jgi:hypothetical protein
MAMIPNIYARNDWLKAIRPLLQFAVPTLIAVNPTHGVKPPSLSCPRRKAGIVGPMTKSSNTAIVGLYCSDATASRHGIRP